MRAVIFDVDGTLCDVRAIRHYVMGESRNFDAFHRASLFCPPNPEVVGLWNAIRPGIAKLVVTARDERYRQVTNDWLTKHSINPTNLFMRPWGDTRKDVIVKHDMLRGILDNGFRPTLAIDDNPNVIDLWEEFGINTIVIPGWGEA